MLWTVARFVPITSAPVVGCRDPGHRAGGLAHRRRAGAARRRRDGAGGRCRGGLGDRVSSALELAVAFPASAGPADPDDDRRAVREPNGSRGDRSVRPPPARDALALGAHGPGRLFRPRFSRRAGGRGVVAALLLAPVLLIPNPQDARHRPAAQVREAAERQAERLDELAHELETKGADAQDPRTRLAQELRDLARQLRDGPDQLDVNLARLGSVEAEVRAQIDPANEQRAASMTSLSRALSSAATGKPDANKRWRSRGGAGTNSRSSVSSSTR